MTAITLTPFPKYIVIIIPQRRIHVDTITVYQVNNQFYIATGQGLSRIEFDMVKMWQKQGSEINILRGEDYV